jgi:hypothetical protein
MQTRAMVACDISVELWRTGKEQYTWEFDLMTE